MSSPLRVQIQDDSDHDGLADTWEYQQFGNLDHDGTEDLDGDGLTNITEFQRGSNPSQYNDQTDDDGDERQTKKN
jgi:hypothetical protein